VNGVAPVWYLEPERQLAAVREWNDTFHWGFQHAHYPERIPRFEATSPLEVLLLGIYLPGVGTSDPAAGHVRTARELWSLARELQPAWWEWPMLRFGEQQPRLLPGTDAAHAPGLRWVAVDLAANWTGKGWVSPRDVRGSDSAHAELLAAAAYFPGWLHAMDGINVPYAWAAGYQVRIPGEDGWTGVPILDWYGPDRGIHLDVYWEGNRVWGAAVPARRELIG
jgi:hypothetical protein